MTPVTPSSVCDMQGERTAAINEEMAAYRGVEGDYMDGSTVKCRLEALWDRAARAALAERTPQSDVQSLIQKYGTRNPANRNGPDGWFLDDEAMRLIGAERTQQEALTDEHRELYFAAYALCDSMCEDHPAISDVFDINSHGRLCNALAKLDAAYGVTSPDDRITADHAGLRPTSAANSTAPMQPSEGESTYTSAIGDAGQAYMARFQYAHPLPALFRWQELWDTLSAAAPTQAAGGEAAFYLSSKQLPLLGTAQAKYYISYRMKPEGNFDTPVYFAAPAAAVEPWTDMQEKASAVLADLTCIVASAKSRAAAVPLSSMPDLQAAVAKGLADGSLVPQGAAAAPEGLTEAQARSIVEGAHGRAAAVEPSDEYQKGFADGAGIYRANAAKAIKERAAAAPEGLTGWNLLTPEGNIAATEATCVRAWARLNGYKLTVEGLLGYEEQGWHVVPATPDAKTAEARKPVEDIEICEATFDISLSDFDQMTDFKIAIARAVLGIGDQS